MNIEDNTFRAYGGWDLRSACCCGFCFKSTFDILERVMCGRIDVIARWLLFPSTAAAFSVATFSTGAAFSAVVSFSGGRGNVLRVRVDIALLCIISRSSNHMLFVVGGLGNRCSVLDLMPGDC